MKHAIVRGWTFFFTCIAHFFFFFGLTLLFLLLLLLPPPILVDSLLASGATSKSKFGVHKIVSGAEAFTATNIIVQAHAFTQSARTAIEANGGKCQLLKRTTGEVLEEVASE